MAEERSDEQWPDTFWGHHRNSLLTSSALILLTIPGVEISESFLGVKFNDNGLAIAVAAFWLASGYSIGALWFEWRAIVHERYKHLRTDIVNLRARILETTEVLNASVSFITTTVPELTARVAEIGEVPRLYLDESPESFRTDFLKRTGLEPHLLGVWDGGKKWGAIEENERQAGQRSEALASEHLREREGAGIVVSTAIANAVIDIGWVSQSEKLALVAADVKRLADTVQSLTATVKGTRDGLDAAAAFSDDELTFHRNRSIGLGIVVPTFVYVLAVLAVLVRFGPAIVQTTKTMLQQLVG